MLFHFWFFNFYLDEEVVFLEQFGFRVTDFSSQYGNAGGVSYTANNILGPPSRFPAYGDFSETFLPVFMICLLAHSLPLLLLLKKLTLKNYLF